MRGGKWRLTDCSLTSEEEKDSSWHWLCSSFIPGSIPSTFYILTCMSPMRHVLLLNPFHGYGNCEVQGGYISWLRQSWDMDYASVALELFS